ncbi:MAG: T9SS type A sorting domain-containing protein [Williamsia sp.]|nr:T9SS type A sorting domain-containing protein [Williamsia sp.]
MTNYYSANVGVLLNNGNGTFAAAVTYASSGSNPNSVAAGDLNGDNKADIAVANYSSGTIGVLLNNGTGVFAPAATYPSGNVDPISVTIGDFNGDGKGDLAAALYISSTIGVLLNNGAGTFAAAVTYPSGGSGPYAVAAGEFNGDGKTDLAVANYSTKTVSVLQNNGTGTFAAAVSYPSGGNNAYALAIGNYNGNGPADIAVANHNSSTVGVLLNNCNPDPCPAIPVSIPDAKALPSGVQPNTVYPGYAPAASITLTVKINGGTGPYNYTWSNGSHNASIVVSPTAKTTYKVSVSDANGCPGNQASITIYVVDVHSGKKGDKVEVCHKPGKLNETLSIAASAVPGHLGHGDMLGSCSRAGSCSDASGTSFTAQAVDRDAAQPNDLSAQVFVKALPNPSRQYFVLDIKTGDLSQPVQLRVVDFYGRVVEQKASLMGNQTLRLGESYKAGIYFAEILQGRQKTVVKLVKQ